MTGDYNTGMEKFGLSNVLTEDLKRSGGKIFQVGGSVRDELLGLDQSKSKDLDLMVVGMDMDTLNRVLSRHGKTALVGKSFGVIKFKPVGWDDEPIDISVPRIDNKTGDGHTDFTVETGKHITLEQDQLRRDFTCNSIAKDIETGELHDLSNDWTETLGQWDIEKKLLRMVSPNSMEDDPLRIFRAVQFSSRFDFEIEPNTMKNIRENVHRIKTVSKDRFLEEFRKLFFKSERPSIGINLMKSTGILRELFPELDERFDSIDLDSIDDLAKDSFVVFLALFFEPVEDAEKIMKEFRFPNDDIQMVKDILDFLCFGLASDKQLVQWNNDRKSKDVILDLLDDILLILDLPTASSRLSIMRFKGIPTKISELPVNGNDLLQKGFKGAEIGKELRSLLLDRL